MEIKGNKRRLLKLGTGEERTDKLLNNYLMVQKILRLNNFHPQYSLNDSIAYYPL